MSLKTYLGEKKRYILNFSLRKRLLNKDFSIISNNCWGGQVSQDLGLKYNSPFAGLFLYAPCYINLLKDLRNNMQKDLVFIEKSKYEQANKERSTNYYPIALLGDCEIHFLHYPTKEDAETKWYRRNARINWNNLFVKFCDRDLCTEELLIEFDAMNFKNKVCFTAKKYPDLSSNVWFEYYKDMPFVENELRDYKKYIDVVKWLNEGTF